MPSTGYCPHCHQNVLMRRDEMNVVLAILLLCCTGIGFFIYLIFHYSKPENQCVHCGSICQATLPSTAPQTAQQIQFQTQSNTENAKTLGKQQKFCPLCGNKLDTGNQNFCANCGSKL